VIESSCPVKGLTPNSNPFPIKKNTKQTKAMVLLVGISTGLHTFWWCFFVFFWDKKNPLDLDDQPPGEFDV
jgi:hypothetical protein